MAIGVDDPEAWLDKVHPKTLALWDAFYKLEPWGSAMEQSAATNSLLSMLISLSAAKGGVEIKPRDTQDFMPTNWVGRDNRSLKKSKIKKGLERARKAIASAFPTLKVPDDFVEALPGE